MRDALIVSALSVVPHHLLCRLQGAVARTGLSRHLIAWFVRRYGVDTSEMLNPPESYSTLQDLFVRELRPGVRPIASEPDAVVSPADSRVSSFGRLTADGKLPPEADYALDIDALVGEPGRFAGGDYAVLYLSPKDYHRVHHPLDARVVGFHYLPGQLWPVYAGVVSRVPQLFARNERLVLWVESERAGRVAAVMVGAWGVGRMSCSHTPVITNTGTPEQQGLLDATARRGEELGRFNLGSTVILAFEPGRVAWELSPDQPVKMGQRIGRLLEP